MDETEATVSTPRLHRAKQAPSAVAPGTVLGRYVVVEGVGRGGMGEVYKAFDPQLDRMVAVKLVTVERSHDERATADAKSRLLKEAKALAQLAHPNVVAVYDAGTVGDSVFVAMELVAGHTLSAWLEKTQPPYQRALEVLVQAGRGLAAAHAVGLVHRDFKPSNVIVGDDGRVRVLDFGIAKVMSAPSADEPMQVATTGAVLPAASDELTTEPYDATVPVIVGGTARSPLLNTPLTRVGVIPGTPAYMAPEQLATGTADARSDLFAYCIVLYEAVYGQRAFGGSAPGAERELAPPPRGSKVPGWLERLIKRGLSEDPEARPASMASLLETIERHAKRRRRRWWTAAAAVLGAAAVAILAATMTGESPEHCQSSDRTLVDVWSPGIKTSIRDAFTKTGVSYASDTWTRIEAALDHRATRWVADRDDACAATMIRGEQSPHMMDLRMACYARHLAELRQLTSHLMSADANVVRRATDAVAGLSPLTDCSDAAALTTSIKPPPAAIREQVESLKARLAEIKVRETLGLLPTAHAEAEAAVAAADELEYEPLRAAAKHRLGRLLARQGENHRAVEPLRESARLALTHGDQRQLAQSANLLVQVEGYSLSRRERGLLWGEIAAAALAAVDDEALDVDHFFVLGALHYQHADYDAALTHYRKALEIAEQQCQGICPRVGHARGWISVIHRAAGNFQLAYEQSVSALEQSRATYGDEHPRTLDAMQSLAMAEHHIGRHSDALPRLRAVLELHDRVYRPDSPRRARVLNNLALVQRISGDLDGAFASLEEAKILLEKALGPDSAHVAYPLVNLGEVHLQRKQWTLAQDALSQALRIWEGTLGADHPALGHALAGLARAFHGAGQMNEAASVIDRASSLCGRATCDRNVSGHIELVRARMLVRRDPDQAREHGRAALEHFRAWHADPALAAEAAKWLEQNAP